MQWPLVSKWSHMNNTFTLNAQISAYTEFKIEHPGTIRNLRELLLSVPLPLKC